MNNNQNISVEKIYDILIVGAGPVGLATAIGLQKQGITNFLVIDQTREFRQVGNTVDLLPNGLKSINYLEPLAYEKIKEFWFNRLKALAPKTLDNKPNQTSNQDQSSQKRYWYNKNLKGEIIHAIPTDFDHYFQQYRGGRVSIPWYELQTTLRNCLPPELIKINHRCVDLEEHQDSITVTCVSDPRVESNPFAHWEMQKLGSDPENNQEQNPSEPIETTQLQAKLVVGADGINSVIRQVLYNDTPLSSWAKPHYSGWTAIACFAIEKIDESMVEALKHQYFQGQSVITLRNDQIKADSVWDESPSIILINREANQIGYLLHIPLPLESVQQQSAQDLIQLALQGLKKAEFPPIIQELVKLSNPETLVKRPYYIHPANIPIKESIWSQGRVVLVGDAAHGMPPFMAQGANQGLEDALVISTLIGKIVQNQAWDDPSVMAEQWAKYEQLRRPFMAKIQEATLENHRWSAQQWDDYSKMVYARNLEQLANAL